MTDHDDGTGRTRPSLPLAPRRDLLVPLGWSEPLERSFLEMAREGEHPARVVARHRGGYRIDGVLGERAAAVAGRLRHDAGPDSLPVVGDWVAAAGAADGTAVITAVLPRRTAFTRKVAGDRTRPQVIAANADVALVVAALPDDLNPRRLERYLTLAWESGALPVLVLNKVDLAPDLPGALRTARESAPGVEVVPLSAGTGEGVEELSRLLRPGRTAVLLGSSGVGKSTLANRLAGREALRTGAVRGDGRGRHTTTHRQIVRLPSGALLMDTPGLREVQMWAADVGLDRAFPEVAELAAACRFADCGHGAEPGCAVREAVASGRLDPERLASWERLQRELAYLERRVDQAAAALERDRVRTVHREHRRRMRHRRR